MTSCDPIRQERLGLVLADPGLYPQKPYCDGRYLVWEGLETGVCRALNVRLLCRSVYVQWANAQGYKLHEDFGDLRLSVTNTDRENSNSS